MSKVLCASIVRDLALMLSILDTDNYKFYTVTPIVAINISLPGDG